MTGGPAGQYATGRCVVVVANGTGHLATLRAVVQDAASSLHPGWRWVDRLAEAFSLENGGDQLSVAFDDIRCVRPDSPGRAAVTDPDVIAGYLASVGDRYAAELAAPWDRLVERVRVRAENIISSEGVFVVEGDVGAFVCS